MCTTDYINQPLVSMKFAKASNRNVASLDGNEKVRDSNVTANV